MTSYTREPSFGNTTRLTGRQVSIVSNSGFTPLLNANDTLTIEAPSINLSTYPDLSGTNGTINFLKSDGSTTIAVETENNLLNMNSHKITNLLQGVDGSDAVNKTQMDTAILGALGGGTSFAISRGGGSVTAETTGQITVSPPVGQATIMTVAGVTKATINTSNLTMAVPIAMGSNKITGLTTATNNDEATNKGQMDTAISTALGGLTTYSISRGGGSATAETTGQMTINVPTGQATIMNVNSVPKATFNTTSLTMAMPIEMGSNKITGLTAGTVAGDGVEFAQMNTAIGTAVADAYSITRASGSVTVGTSGQITNTVVSGQFADTIVGGTRFIRTNAINGTGFSTYIKVPSVSFTAQPIYTSGPALGSYMDITGGATNTIAGGDSLKTLQMDFATTSIKGKSAGGIPFILYDYLGTTTKMNYDEANDKVNVYTGNGLAMNSKKITGLLTATNNDEATNKGQMDTAIATAIGGIVSHNAYEIIRGTTSLYIDGGGVMTLSMPINTASFSIIDPSNTGIYMSNWDTQSGVSYNTNRCRTRVQSPSGATPYLQQWFNTGYGTAGTQTEILSSASMNLCVAGSTDHINFRHSSTSLIARIASDYFDSFVTAGQRIYTDTSVLRYTIDTSTTDVVITPANDSLSIKGKTIFQPQADSTTAFRFRKAGVTTAFIDIDTTNNVLNMNTNKITGVATATTSDGAVNKGQMDTAISAGTPTSITQGGGTVSASTVGQITINPASGQATVMSVAGTTKATLNTSNLIMAVPIVMGYNNITDVADPTSNQHVATKKYVDDQIGNTNVIIDNIVRNPTMAINQRVQGSISNGMPVDGWNTSFVNPYATIVQEVINDLPGFRWCVKTTTTSASSSRVHIYSSNEGTMTRDLQLGSPYTSVMLTISAWVKSSIANHKFCFAILYGSYECPSSTITGTANTWVRVSATFPVPPLVAGEPTTGTGNSINWEINPSIPASEGGTNQVWNNTAIGRAFGLSDGTTNMMNIAGTNTFRYTGVQVDVGTVMLPFRHIAHDENLRRCQRYYYRITSNTTSYPIAPVTPFSTTYQLAHIKFNTYMRVVPILTKFSSTCITVVMGPTFTPVVCSAIGLDTSSVEMGALSIAVNTSNSGGWVWLNSVGAWIAFDADI